MSTKRDHRVVEMSFDNRDFEKNVKTSLSTIEKLNQALKLDKATEGMLAVENAIASVSVQPLLNSVENLQQKFSAFGVFGMSVLNRLANSAVDAGKKIWDNTLGQIQSGGSQRALNIANAQFKLEGLGVAWEQASKDISAAVDGTAYGFDAAANTASQLATAGIALGESYGGMAHALRAVSGIAAMTNSSYEEIGYIFSQIASAGRLMGQDAMQISTRGINVTSVLAKQLGKTTEEISEMQRKGEISFAMFAEAMNDAFGDQATKANNTFQGAMSNVRAALSRIGEVFYGPFYKSAITPLNRIRETINRIKKMLDDGDDSTRDLKDRLTELLNTLSNIFSFFTQHADLRFFRDVTNAANVVLDKLNLVAHGWERILGIFGKETKSAESVDQLTESLDRLKDKEIEAVRAIWIEGAYGTGEARVSALKQAGFDEDEINRVQLALNRLVESGQTWDEFQKELKTDVAETNEEVKVTEKLSSSLVSSKIARTLERVSSIFTYIRLTVTNLGRSIVNVGKTIFDSFLTTFPFDKIADDVQRVMYRIWNLSESLVNITTNNSTIKRIADEIFTDVYNIYRIVKSLARIAITAAKSLWSVLSKNVEGLDTSWITLTNITDAIATFSEKIADSAETGKFFTDIFQKMVDGIKSGIDYIKNIPNYISSAATKAKNYIIDISAKIEKLTGINILPFLTNIKSYFESFASILSNPFKSREGGGESNKPGIVVAAENIKQRVIDIFNKPEELAKGISDWFNNSLQLAKDKIKTVNITNTITAFKRFKKALKELTDSLTINVDLGKFLQNARYAGAIGASVMSIVTAFNINKLVEILKKPSIQLKNIVSTVVSTFNSISYSFKTLGKNIDKIGTSIAWNIRSDVIMKIALSIAVMSGSLVAIALLPFDKMLAGVMAITAISASMTTMILATSFLAKSGPDSKANTTIIQTTALISVMGVLMKTLSGMSYEDITKATVAIIALEASIGAMMIVINASTQLARDKKTKEVVKEQKTLTGSILAVSALMGVMTIALTSMTTILKIIGPDSGDYLAQSVISLIGTMAAVIGAVVGATAVAKKLNVSDLEKTVKTLTVAIVSLNALVPVITVFTLLSYYTKNEKGYSSVGNAIAAVAASLTLIFAALTGLTKFTNVGDLTATASALAIVMAALNALIPIMSILAILDSKMPGSLGDVGFTVAIMLGGCSVILGVLSSLTVDSDIILTAGALGIVMMSMVSLVPIFRTLSKINTTQLWNIVGAVSVWGIIFAAIIGVLAAADAGTAHGVSLVMAALAADLLTLGYSIQVILAGLAKLIVAVGSTVKDFINLIKYFSSINTSDIDKAGQNIKTSITEFCRVLTEVLPNLGETVLTFVMFLNTLLVDIEPYVMSFSNKLFEMLVKFITNMAVMWARALESVAEVLLTVESDGNTFVYNVVNKVVRVIMEVIRAIFDAVFEETKDPEVMGPMQPGQEQKSQSFFEKVGNWLVDGFVQAMKVAYSRAGEIGDWFIKFLVAASNAAADALFNHSDEIAVALTRLWLAFQYTIIEFAKVPLSWAGEELSQITLSNMLGPVGGAIWNFFVDYGERLRTWHEKLFNIGHYIFDGLRRGAFGILGVFVNDITGAFDKLAKLISEITTKITNAMDLAGKSGVLSFASEFSDQSAAGKKALQGVTGFGAYITQKFVKSTGTGSYNPKTGYAGKWMGVSVPMGMEKVKGRVNSALESLGEGFANRFVGSVTGGGNTGKKSILQRIGDFIMGDSDGLGGGRELIERVNFNDYVDDLSIDSDDFQITPVIDMSEIETGMDDISNMLDSSDYDIGLSTTSDLASSIGTTQYDGEFSTSTTSADLSNLTAEVRNISDKINRLEVRIDSGTLVGAIVDKMNNSLGEKQILAGRGVLA